MSTPFKFKNRERVFKEARKLDIYLADIKKYASLRVLISYFQITRAEWEWQGCE